MAGLIPCTDVSDKRTVDVWVVDLDDRTAPAPLVDGILTAEERARAARFVFEAEAWHFKLCRAMLRIGLAVHLGKRAQDIQIRTAEKGKPYLNHGGIHFNVSHCGGVGLLAFMMAGEVGVDVEAVRPDVEGLDIASQNFTAQEVEFIASGENAVEQSHRFTRLWTRKEAVLKATGDGITNGLKSFDVSQGNRVAIRRDNETMPGKEDHLIVMDIAITESILGAVCGPDLNWIICPEYVNPSNLLAGLQADFPHLL